MYWEKPFIKTNGLPRKYFKSLKLPRGMPVKDGETLFVGISYGEESYFRKLSVSGGGGELVLPTKLAVAIASFAAANPEESVHFTCEDIWEGATPSGSEIRPAQSQEIATTEREALISARIG